MARNYLTNLVFAGLIYFSSACGAETRVINDDDSCKVRSRNEARTHAENYVLNENPFPTHEDYCEA